MKLDEARCKMITTEKAGESNTCIKVVTHEIPFFEVLDESEQQQLCQAIMERSFEKGEIIHMEKAACKQLFFVKSGKIKMSRISGDGHEQIYEILGKGGTCTCNPGHAQWSCATMAEALTPCTVWFLATEHYVRLVQGNPRVRHVINELFARRLMCFTDMIDGFTLKDSKKRLIKFLLDMVKSARSLPQRERVLYIPATREQIARQLGVARETVARHISDLRSRQLIDVKPFQIIIRDQQALEKLL